MVNNAGLFANQTLLGATDMAVARQEMEVNYFGTLAMCRAFAPVLGRNGGGAIINVLSAAALISIPNMGGYGPSKAATRSLSGAVRAELSPQGTQVTALIVGSVDTRMASHVEGGKEKPDDIARAGPARRDARHRRDGHRPDGGRSARGAEPRPERAREAHGEDAARPGHPHRALTAFPLLLAGRTRRPGARRAALTHALRDLSRRRER